MAAVITLSLSSSSLYHHLNSHSHTPHFLNPKQHHHHHPLFYPKCDRFNHLLLHSSPSSSSSTTFQQDPFQPGRFVTNEELQKLQLLRNFSYFQELETGSMWARVMREDEIDMVVGLLAQSFAESMFMFLPNAFVSLVGVLVKEHLVERRSLMPNIATLIAFFKEKNGEEEEELAGTVEIIFNQMGANDSPPTPTPPKDDPYICNMTVNQSLRRRGIGWNLLKASEELISQMSSSREIYLHCRMVDIAPFKMYTRAGYSVVKTDNILILLTLQRRKHLMRKQLPVSNTSLEREISDCSEKHPS